MQTHKTPRYGGALNNVPAPDTSRHYSMCGFITPGCRTASRQAYQARPAS